MSKSWIAATVAITVVIAAASVLAPSADANPKGKGVFAAQNLGGNGLGAGATGSGFRTDSSASDAVARIIDNAVGAANGGLGLPPSLAKRAQLPPSLRK